MFIAVTLAHVVNWKD